MSNNTAATQRPVVCVSGAASRVGDHINIVVTAYRGEPHNTTPEEVIKARIDLCPVGEISVADQLRFALRDALIIARDKIH